MPKVRHVDSGWTGGAIVRFELERVQELNQMRSTRVMGVGGIVDLVKKGDLVSRSLGVFGRGLDYFESYMHVCAV